MNENELVPLMGFSETVEYLDESIKKWRNIRLDPEHDLTDLAPYYIDAFQSVRTTITGEELE